MELLSLRESDGLVVFNNTSIVDLFKKHKLEPDRNIFFDRFFRCGCLITVLSLEKSEDPKRFLDKLCVMSTDKQLEIMNILNISRNEFYILVMGWDNKGIPEGPMSKDPQYKLAQLAYNQTTFHLSRNPS